MDCTNVLPESLLDFPVALSTNNSDLYLGVHSRERDIMAFMSLNEKFVLQIRLFVPSIV